jgi:hypothetical protein
MANARENGRPEPEARAEHDAPYQTSLAKVLAARGFVAVASRKHNGAAVKLRAW